MSKVEKRSSYQRKSAIIAGISLLIMTIAAAFSYGMVHVSLVVENNANATLTNLMSSTTLFNAEIFGWLIIIICDIIVAWSFYIFLEPIQKRLSLLAAWLRLIYASILGIALLNLVFVLILMKNPDYVALIEAEQLQMYVMMFLEAFDLVWSIGLVIFGGHLMLVGYLTFKSSFIPKVISILLFIAAIGYIIIHLSFTFLPQYGKVAETLEAIFIIPMTAGELGFGLWLLFKGGKVQKS